MKKIIYGCMIILGILISKNFATVQANSVAAGFPKATYNQNNITYTVSEITKPLANNTLHVIMKVPAIQIGMQLDNNIGFYYSVIQKTTSPITIQWLVSNNVAKVEMIWDGNIKRVIDVPFTGGQTGFSLSLDNKTIRLWMNRYIFRAYAKDALYESIIGITYFDPQKSLKWEEYRKSTGTIGYKLWQKYNPCNNTFTQDKDEAKRQKCIADAKKEFIFSKEKACSLSDGSYGQFLDVKRWNKIAETRWFLKKDGILYYEVNAGSENASCESKDYESSIYSYNCSTKKPQEVLGYDKNTARLSHCGYSIVWATSKYLVYNRFSYELEWGWYLLDRNTKKETQIQPLSDKSKYEWWDQWKKKWDIVKSFFEWNYDEFNRWDYFTINITKCDNNLVCDIIRALKGNELWGIYYPWKMDVLKKKIY